jgi:Putative Actinobacterial Holin-X, holin superfamily III
VDADDDAADGLAPNPVASAGDDLDRQPVSELAEEVSRDLATLAVRRAQLALSEQAPEVQRAVRASALAGIGVVALLTAFVFGNWAAASALSSPLPGWRAPLVLAAAWLAVGLLVTALFLRSERPARSWLQGLRADPAATMRRREQSLEEAEQALRQTLDRLSDAIALAAEERIAAAILPTGGMVEVGGDMVEATDEVIEAADEITDALEEAVPGGVVVNRAVDLALAPGRLGVRVARTVLTLGRNETEEG